MREIKVHVGSVMDVDGAVSQACWTSPMMSAAHEVLWNSRSQLSEM